MSTQHCLPRVRRPLLALALAWMLVVAAPRLTHPEPAPAPTPAALAASLVAPDDSILSSQENAILRLAVSPCAVRLPVDKNARHPLHGPVAVRRDVRLGSLERPLRLVTLAAAEPEPRAAPAVSSVPAPASAPAPVVKIPSRQTATLAAPLDKITPAAAPATSPLPGKRILVAGDSLSLFLADALRPMLAGRPQTAFASRGKVSSGLARPDFFDWEREMAALVAANHPDTVIVMIATNDNQTMTRPDGVKVAFGRPAWNEEYARRVRRLTELARSANPAARVFWLGAPVMADPRLNADVAAINAVIAHELAGILGCRFIDVSRTLADAAGHYAQALSTPDGPRVARTRDGVHLTPYGARLLAGATLASLGPNLASLTRP
ncbi:MAG: DUF459 domain-containing protein [Acidobacteriota bacterium]